MSDNAVLDKNPITSASVTGQVQSQAPTQAILAVGGANKEIIRVAAPVSEFVTRSGAETIPNIPPEVSEANVKISTDKPFLTPAHKEVGLDHSGPDVSVPTSPTGLVQITEKKDVSSSGTWLNTLLEKIRKVGKLVGV